LHTLYDKRYPSDFADFAPMVQQFLATAAQQLGNAPVPARLVLRSQALSLTIPRS